MIKNPSDESAARPLVALQTRNACEAQSGFQVSCSDASPYPGANEVGGHDRGKHYLLSTYYSRTLWYLELCTAAVSSYVIRTKSQLRKVRGFALTSDLQKQRSSIMMHPAENSAARRHRCSHALIPSRQPGSIFTSTWSLSRAFYVRVSCVRSLCVLRVENLSS